MGSRRRVDVGCGGNTLPKLPQCSRRRSNYWVTVYSTEMIKVLHGAEAEGVQLGRVEPWQ
jgi:hypothetical protein